MTQDINHSVEGQVLKVDDDERLVYGWASVISENGKTLVDRQGDVISAPTLTKAVNKFMQDVRVGKEMHSGKQIGVVVNSWVVTKETNEAMGIQSDREGWMVSFRVFDDEVWKRVKSGELSAFSIGGRARKENWDA